MPEVRRVTTASDHHHLLRLAPAVPLELKAAARTGRIEGVAAPFGPPPDRQREIWRPGAFTKTLADHAGRGTRPAMLWMHKQESPIGRWLDLREDSQGLAVAGQLNLDTGVGRKAFDHIDAGDVMGLSPGYIETVRKYVGDGVFELVEVDLGEISIVSVPAAPGARLMQIKSLGSRTELVDLLRDIGLAKAAALRIAAGGWPALAGDDRDEAAMRLAAAFEKSLQHLKGA